MDHDILKTLKYGSKEEIGKAITALSRLKDLSYKEILRDLKDSADPYLSVMAAYALGEAGDPAGLRFLEQILGTFSGMLPFMKGASPSDLKIVEEVLSLPDALSSALGLYNRSYYLESREKLLKVLQLYSIDIPKMGVPHFDDLVKFSVSKTRGLIFDAIAVCEFTLGNINKALKHIMEAVTIAQEVDDSQLLKISYGDLGYFHMSMGNYYSALELFHKSLEIDEASHDPWRKRNRTISNLSLLYYHIGQHTKAQEYNQEALRLAEGENDLNGMARCLNAAGVILCGLNEFENAGEYLQKALDFAMNKLQDRALQGLILNNLAYLHYSLSKTEEARQYLSTALDLAVAASDKSTEAAILSSIAMLEGEAGDVDNARLSARSALEITRAIHDRPGQADANYVLGSIEDYGYDNPTGAYEYYREAIDQSETLRKNLLFDDFKISFAGNHASLYQQMISLCIETGKIDDAFKYIEGAKSRALVDMLASTANTINSRTVQFAEREEIANLKGRLDLLRRQIGSSGVGMNGDPAQGREFQSEINDLERTYLKTLEELKLKDPDWTSLVSVDTFTVEEIQKNLDDGTVLLEFYQTGTELFVIAITRCGPPSVVRIPIDVQADSEKLYNLFSALSKGKIDIRSHEYVKTIKQPLSYFYKLLISPLKDDLKDARHLVIVPHYFWHYLPFHALYDEVSKEHLIDTVSISYAPSATALSLCMEGNIPSPLAGEGNGKGECRSHGKSHSVLILANPSGDLPFSEEEAEKIGAKFGDSGHVFKRELASLGRLFKYSEADMIHLACHAYFRADEPLFSHLMLADTEGGISPCFLPDIFNLRLKASLVTLSACETGLSEFTAGDELIGMSRAFFYAGAPALLASLWTVNDKSTALLMDGFYEELVNNKRNKADALRSAIRILKSTPEYSQPYFWAAFFLSGDWR